MQHALPLLDVLRDRIRGAGLRATSSRLAVLSSIASAGRPLSHAEVMEELGPSGRDRATLFRNLADLAEVGILHRFDPGDHTWRYELREEHDPTSEGVHAHFICEDCGDLQCLPDVEVRVAPAQPAPEAIARRAVRVQISGICDVCA